MSHLVEIEIALLTFAIVRLSQWKVIIFVRMRIRVAARRSCWNLYEKGHDHALLMSGVGTGSIKFYSRRAGHVVPWLMVTLIQNT